MLLARVKEPVVSTAKVAGLTGQKLLLVEIVTSRPHGLQGTGRHLVCVDSVGAGPGELVLAVQGSSARLAGDLKDTPSDAVIVGIVDSLRAGGAAVGIEATAQRPVG
jgi:microcompartment protein CcmK/EutM